MDHGCFQGFGSIRMAPTTQDSDFEARHAEVLVLDLRSSGIVSTRRDYDFEENYLDPSVIITCGCCGCCCIFMLVGPFLRALLLQYLSFFPPFGGNKTPSSSFHLYRPDLDLCVQSGDSQNLKLEACKESETWMYVDHHLQSELTKMCVTCMTTDYSAWANNWVYDYTSADPASVVWPNCTFLAMLECTFDSGSEISQRQNWSFVDGRFLYSKVYTQQQGRDDDDLSKHIINPYNYIISTPLCMWVDRANATVKPCGWLDQLTALVAFDMSYFSIKDCTASDDFCYNNGTFNHASCSCECMRPWGGLDCRAVNEGQTGNLTCREKQSIGPAFQYSPAGLADQARAVLDGSVELWLSIAVTTGSIIVDALADVFMLVITCGLMTAECCVSCCPCLRVVFFVCFSMKLALDLVWYPLYAQYRPGHWPHADRAILFCGGNVGFSSYLFFIYAAMNIQSFKGVVQLLCSRKAENMLDDYEILPGVTAAGTSKATVVLQEETSKTYSLCGVLLSQAFRNPLGLKLWLCILLLVLQVWELLALTYFRNNNADFLRMELLFGVIQDFPEFCICLWIALSGDIDEFVIYSQVGAAIAVMKQLARALHSLRLSDGYEEMRTADP